VETLNTAQSISALFIDAIMGASES